MNKPESMEAKRVRELLDESHLASFQFTKLHRAYLGLSGDYFPTILSSIDRTEIDEKDNNSRTTLSWAAARNDQSTVGELLAFGADPNRADDKGRTSLHWALWESPDAGCARLLLKAKARVNVQDREGKDF